MHMNKCHNFVIIIIFSLLIQVNNSLKQCETLSPDMCLAAYPNCMHLYLTSCCPGQTGVCTDLDNVVEYLSNKKDNITGCLREISTGRVYEMWGDINDIPGFEVYPIPNKTCKDLGCESKGLECINVPASTECESSSLCCKPQPECSEYSKLLLTNVSYGNGNCDASCDSGFNCRIIFDKPKCIPSKCDLITCPEGTECLQLHGLDLVSCFKSIIPDYVEEVTCDKVRCPAQFTCGKGIFSNADCIPLNIDLVGEDFDCGKCLNGWACDKFGWGGLCIEWKPTSPGDGLPCLGGVCLFNQFCNETSRQCEFERCSETVCAKEMSCIQYQPSHPRVCASTNVIPFTSLPESLIQYTERFNDDLDDSIHKHL